MEKYRTRKVSNEQKDAQQKETRETGLWSVQEAADYFNVSERTIRREIGAGKLPHLRIGGCVRLPRRAILDWAETETRYNLGCVETMCASKGEKPCQSLNVVIEEVKTTTSMSTASLEARLNDLLEPVTND